MEIFENNFFILDKNNWQNFKEPFFYGYKKDDNLDFSVKITRENNNIIFNTSYLPPCIIYYRTKNYWAISNSLYYLEEYLRAKNYELTENSDFKRLSNDFTKSPSRIAYAFIPEETTKFNEIKLLKLLDYIVIDNGEFEIKTKTNIFVNTNFNLDDFYISYINFVQNNRNNLLFKVSGGLDSVLLYFLFGKKFNSRIINYESINNLPKDEKIITSDRSCFLRLVKDFQLNNYCLINNISDKYSDYDNYDLNKAFFYGIAKTWRACNIKYYFSDIIITGSASEYFSDSRYNQLPILTYLKIIRKTIIQQFIAEWYLHKSKNFPIFLDYRLLTFIRYKDMYAELLKYCPELSGKIFYKTNLKKFITLDSTNINILTNND